MATRVTDGARSEKQFFFFLGCRPRFARLAASPLARACTPLTKPEEKVETARSLHYNLLHGRVVGLKLP